MGTGGESVPAYLTDMPPPQVPVSTLIFGLHWGTKPQRKRSNGMHPLMLWNVELLHKSESIFFHEVFDDLFLSFLVQPEVLHRSGLA